MEEAGEGEEEGEEEEGGEEEREVGEGGGDLFFFDEDLKFRLTVDKRSFSRERSGKESNDGQ